MNLLRLNKKHVEIVDSIILVQTKSRSYKFMLMDMNREV